MGASYSADISNILAKSRFLADAVRYTEEMPHRFRAGCDEYAGCWGEEDEDRDPLALALGTQDRLEQEQALESMRTIHAGFLPLVEVLAAEARHVQRPQIQALDDIHAQGAESENRR